MKPRYRLNLDGSTSLVSCSPQHFLEVALSLSLDMTGLEVTRLRKRSVFVRNVRRELSLGRSLEQQAPRLDLSVEQLKRILNGTSGLPPDYTVTSVTRGMRLPEEARP